MKGSEFYFYKQNSFRRKHSRRQRRIKKTTASGSHFQRDWDTSQRAFLEIGKPISLLADIINTW
jgi:hypothetical protein